MITKKNARIIFMGTPQVATSYLQCLIENNFNIIGVYSQPPRRKDRGMIIKKSPVQIWKKIQLDISNWRIGKIKFR